MYSLLLIICFLIFLILLKRPVDKLDIPKESVYTTKATLTPEVRPGTQWYNEFLFERDLIDHGIYTDFTTKNPLREIYTDERRGLPRLSV